MWVGPNSQEYPDGDPAIQMQVIKISVPQADITKLVLLMGKPTGRRDMNPAVRGSVPSASWRAVG